MNLHYPHTISIIDCVKSLDVWLGLAFERLCVKNARYLAEIMGFAPKVIRACPHFGKADRSFRIDLLYLRADNVITVCEVKCYNAPVSTSIAPELQAKIDSLKVPRGYSVEKALISLYGPDKALKNAGIFDYSVTLEDILGVRKG